MHAAPRPSQHAVPLKSYVKEGTIKRYGNIEGGLEAEVARLFCSLLDTPGNCSPQELSHVIKRFPGSSPEKVVHHRIEKIYWGDMKEYKKMWSLMCCTEPYAYHYHELPLHRAIFNNCSLAVVRFLVDTFPESIFMCASGRKSPLHLACGKYKDEENTTPQRKNGYNLEMIRYLIQLHPGALQSADKTGCLPLHHAVQSGAHLDVVQLLIEAYPGALGIKRHLPGSGCCRWNDRKVFGTPLQIALHPRRFHIGQEKQDRCSSEVTDLLSFCTDHPRQVEAIFVRARQNPMAFLAALDQR